MLRDQMVPEEGASVVQPGVLELLSSPLLDTEELGQLRTIEVTFRTNPSGTTHAVGCRHLGKRATDVQTITIGEYRMAAARYRICRGCGGGVLATVDEQQVEALTAVWRPRAEHARQAAAEARRLEEVRTRAEAIDQRARDVIGGWKWNIERELPRAAAYPDGSISAPVNCRDCQATALITFEPRTLQVGFVCSTDPEHGFFRLGDDDEPFAMWNHGEAEYVALTLVAPVLAGADSSWNQIFGTRLEDYRATVKALADFDARHPEPLRLAPDIRCGECGRPLRSYPPVDLEGGRRREASYACDKARHEDGKYRRHDKHKVDSVIDRTLRRLLRPHPDWTQAPELELNPTLVEQYEAELREKIRLYDTHIGAAAADGTLTGRRAALVEKLAQVTAIREQGALSFAGLTEHPISYGYASPSASFSELARALLTTSIEVTADNVAVTTRIDPGTPLHRQLRLRELNQEIIALRERQRELEAELADLSHNPPT